MGRRGQRYGETCWAAVLGVVFVWTSPTPATAAQFTDTTRGVHVYVPG